MSALRCHRLAGLRRPWINEKDRTITLPDWLTKNGAEHVFPYGDMVASILEVLPRRNSTDLLFPSFVSDDRPISGWSKYKKEMEADIEHWVFARSASHVWYEISRTESPTARRRAPSEPKIRKHHEPDEQNGERRSWGLLPPSLHAGNARGSADVGNASFHASRSGQRTR
jgi:hypothetical protein